MKKSEFEKIIFDFEYPIMYDTGDKYRCQIWIREYDDNEKLKLIHSFNFIKNDYRFPGLRKHRIKKTMEKYENWMFELRDVCLSLLLKE